MRLMKLLWPAALLAALAACSKHEPQKPPPAKPAAQPDPWKEFSAKDSMTDVVTYLLTTLDHKADARFDLRCDPESEDAAFRIALFLGPDDKRTIQYRLDDEKAEERSAFFTKQTVLMPDQKRHLSPEAESVQYALRIDARAFLAELKARPHRRLRVRLETSDRQTIDLDFNIAGVRTKLAAMERKCADQP